MKLTENFDRDEFGDVPPQYEGHVLALANLLQAFRSLAGVPFIITKPHGVYRSPEVNATTPGAADDSQHLTASAADGDFLGITNRELVRRVLAARAAGRFPTWGQLILYDYDYHVHISLPRLGGNDEILYARHGEDGKPHYTRVTSAADVPAISSVAKHSGSALAVLLISLIVPALFARK